MIEIDRNKIYESHGYRFKNFVCLSDEEKRMVLEWRNHEKVRCMMVNKDVIPLENHIAFIDSLKHRDDCYYWLVIDPRGINTGVLDIIHVDDKEDIGEIGFYLNQDEVGNGFEFMIECNFFVFNQLQLKYNIATVDATNKDILLFNLYLAVSFKGIKEINGVKYLFHDRGTGDYIIKHYDEINLIKYAQFVSKHKKDNLSKIIEQLLDKQ